ncbi:ABC-type multidrug transport system, ATPase component [Marinitoga piezophila KA3]|uniref:ABC-type multidrug transport system, ATPase component n=1 Tax=Marinitoga piezophila (strain DSM 14283 / JCM 11233 / KA3) TaxID=443254 RepID=H2J573_MARPK|nr:MULTISPECIES: ABC transporter ATP-binding protein [Marinitoga]AEX84931.1 ABC-type multidrug transport system, ATPase component [Marinitoga piezophila KA3]APT75437.1 ABC transporter ATP-binding protein [Marinitoga sp. 1137]
MKKIIEIKHLKKYYKNVKAVDDISFDVYEGEVFAFLGPNGAGKTTTLEIIEGLRKKDSGEIIYFDKYTDPSDNYIKQRIGVQLQNSAFFDNLTVYETLKMFEGLYPKTREADEILEIMSLNEKKNSKVKKLSGGQKQRLAIGVALINDPDILFLDEPTTGLDPQSRRNIWEIVLNLKKAGKTIVLTTHYMEEAEYLSDRVYIIDHGKIIANGSVNELIKSLNKKSIITFETKTPDLFLDKFREINVTNEKVEIETNEVEKVLFEILNLTKKSEITVDNLTIRKPNLEDVFLHLTGRSLRD